MQKKLLLCVDDEPTGLRIRKLILELEGYEVLSAPHGTRALELFPSQPVDLVILDYYMPKMNGDEVAARMRQLKPGVPIIMLSAYVSLPEGALKDVDAHLVKGDPTEFLLGTIARLLSRK